MAKVKDSRTYSEKLKDPRWQKRRLEILDRDNWTCFYCFDTKSTLHVHHEYYDRGKDPWDYKDECLTAICEDCHSTIHLLKSDIEKVLYKALRSRMRRDGQDVKKLNEWVRSAELMESVYK